MTFMDPTVRLAENTCDCLAFRGPIKLRTSCGRTPAPDSCWNIPQPFLSSVGSDTRVGSYLTPADMQLNIGSGHTSFFLTVQYWKHTSLFHGPNRSSDHSVRALSSLSSSSMDLPRLHQGGRFNITGVVKFLHHTGGTYSINQAQVRPQGTCSKPPVINRGNLVFILLSILRDRINM